MPNISSVSTSSIINNSTGTSTTTASSSSSSWEFSGTITSTLTSASPTSSSSSLPSSPIPPFDLIQNLTSSGGGGSLSEIFFKNSSNIISTTVNSLINGGGGSGVVNDTPSSQASASASSSVVGTGGGGSFSKNPPSLVSLLTDSIFNASSYLFASSGTSSHNGNGHHDNNNNDPSASSSFGGLEGMDNMDQHWSVEDAFVEGSHLWFLLVAGYILVFVVGVIGNAFLLAALCGSGSRARALPVRNHLMVNLAIADMLVTAVCVPISACAAASHACWPSFLVSWMCQLGPLLQRTPVATSTLSLALLSLDRWAALRHPRFAQRFRDKRFVAMSIGSIWILATLVSAPTFWVREWDDRPSFISDWDRTSQMSSSSSSSSHLMYMLDSPAAALQVQYNYSSQIFSGDESSTSFNSNSSGSSWSGTTGSTPWQSMPWTGKCIERWTNAGIQLAYAATYLGTAFVSPALIVAACHASVSQKLTAQLQVLSGAANGGGGDKVRQRPKQVIIVARDLNNTPNNLNNTPNNVHGLNPYNSTAGNGANGGLMENTKIKVVPCDPNSDDDDVFLRMQIQADLESFRQISQLQQTIPRNRHGLIGVRRGSPGNPKRYPLNRRLRKKLSNPPPLLPTYSSQSFRSRRRAANLLAALAAVFVFCWVPYVLVSLWDMFASGKSIVRLLIPFALFLGHAHSAINPIVSWRLNRSAFVRFQRQPLLSFLPNWSLLSCCRTCTCPCGCDTLSPSMARSHPTTRRSTVGVGGNYSSCRFCFCCSCPTFGQFRRSSSPEGWNRNGSSTNEAGLGAFHPKYLNRLPIPADPISKCHTSHFLK